MNEAQCLDTCGQFIPHLDDSLQFWWGFFGGILVVFFTFLIAIANRRRTEKAKRAPVDCWDFLFFVLWLGLPVLTGFAAQMVDATTKGMAAFDGLGTATMFYYAAAHISGLFAERQGG